MTKNPLKTLIVALIIPLLLTQGCSKEDEQDSVPQTEISSLSESEKVEIDELKIFLAELSLLPEEKLVYNEKDKSFYYKDVMQITKERLQEIKAKR